MVVSARNTSLALALFASFGLGGMSISACAGSEEPNIEDPGGTKTDAGTKDATASDAARDTAPTPSPEAAPPKDTCAPSCTTDDQCKTSCTVPSAGTYCCDTKVGKCFNPGLNVCPAPVDPPDSSTPPTTSP